MDEAPQSEQPFRALNEARLVRGILPAIGKQHESSGLPGLSPPVNWPMMPFRNGMFCVESV